MKATTSADVLEDAPRPVLLLGEMEALSSADQLQNSPAVADPIFTSSPAAHTNDTASGGDTTSVSSASPSVSASLSAVDSMEATTPSPGPSRPFAVPPPRVMRRCVSDVGLEPAVPIFPSLPDSYLQQLGLVYEPSAINNEAIMEQDIENKFVSVSLAIRTDRLTLEARHEQQKKLRDQAMHNVEQEFANLHAALHRLNYLCTDSESIDILTNIKEQANFLLRAVENVSGSSETLGAVRQEERVSRAWDVAVSHAENVKLLLENARTDLEDTRRLLSENRQQRVIVGDIEPSALPGSIARIRPITAVERPGSKRRASIAAIARPVTPAGPLVNGRSFVDGSSRSRSAMRIGLYYPRTSTSETTLTSLDSSDLAETLDSVNGEESDCGKELGESRVDQMVNPAEDATTILADSDDGSINFLSPDDAFSGEEPDSSALPQVSHAASLIEEPVTLLIRNQMPPTFRWLRERAVVGWTAVETLLENLLPPDMEQLINSGRKFVVGLLLMGAAWCVIQIFVPLTSYGSSAT